LEGETTGDGIGDGLSLRVYDRSAHEMKCMVGSTVEGPKWRHVR
jgi:hypothetical protein